jgi:uncharacterized membrane protein
VAFAATFIFIGIAWAAHHHDMFHYIRRNNHIPLMINLLFLISIALQPFSTALMAEHFGKPNERAAAFIYYGVLLPGRLKLQCNLALWVALKLGGRTPKRTGCKKFDVALASRNRGERD